MKTQFIVGSTTSVKIKAVQEAVATHHKTRSFYKRVRGVEVASGVSQQPLSTLEIITGAANRARAAREAEPDAWQWFGLEAGAVAVGSCVFDVGYAVVLDQKGHWGIGGTEQVAVPPLVAERVMAGQEMSVALHRLYGADTITHRDCISLLSNNRLNSVTYYQAAVAGALADVSLNHRLEMPN